MIKDKLAVVMTSMVTAIVTSVLVSSALVTADGNPQTDQVPRLLAYHGTLDKDGAGVNATVEMTFSIYDGLSTDAASWTEVHTVPVYAGKFSVLLGSTSADSVNTLAGVVTAADDLYLGVSVKDGDQWVPLSNKQRFLPVPYSHWTTAATNFTVANELVVQGKGKVSDTLLVEGDNVAATGDVDNPFSYTLKIKNGGHSMVLDGNEIEANSKLYLNSTNDHGVHIGGDLQVPGKVTGGLEIQGDDVEPLEGDEPFLYTLKLKSGTQVMALDGNEINSTHQLLLNYETSNGVMIGGHLEGEHLDCRHENCGATIHEPGTAAGYPFHAWTKCPGHSYLCGIHQSQGPLASGEVAVRDLEILCCPF